MPRHSSNTATGKKKPKKAPNGGKKVRDHTTSHDKMVKNGNKTTNHTKKKAALIASNKKK